MAWLDSLKTFFALEPMQDRVELSTDAPAALLAQVAVIRERNRTVRLPSIAEAMSVPAIQRAVTLISHTVGSTSMQGWRNGAPMPETPVVLARPNPYETPYDFYRDAAYHRATRGETVLWIANRDGDGYPLALVNVPPWELTVQATSDRMRPDYFWGIPYKPGTIKGTRYSPANPTGDFVHIMYHRDATGLRGEGPLQMCGLAVSVAVEAMQWASNFYTGGGRPPIVVKSATDLDPTPDPVTGLNEAQLFKRDWMAGNPNEPKVIDPGVESVEQFDNDPNGGQMLDGRNASNGDAARIFGIPGVLLEFNMSGSSLTYQSIPDVWIEFLRGCLAPTYFEPFEAHMSDLLPRTQAARFNTAGLQRADIKTRYDVYNIGVPLGIMSKELAQQQEGIIPGDIELMPIPPSPPQAVIGLSREVRCTGAANIRGALRTCNAKLAESGGFVGTCRRCGTHYPARVA